MQQRQRYILYSHGRHWRNAATIVCPPTRTPSGTRCASHAAGFALCYFPFVLELLAPSHYSKASLFYGAKPREVKLPTAHFWIGAGWPANGASACCAPAQTCCFADIPMLLQAGPLCKLALRSGTLQLKSIRRRGKTKVRYNGTHGLVAMTSA